MANNTLDGMDCGGNECCGGECDDCPFSSIVGDFHDTMVDIYESTAIIETSSSEYVRSGDWASI